MFGMRTIDILTDDETELKIITELQKKEIEWHRTSYGSLIAESGNKYDMETIACWLDELKITWCYK
ncbi:hypothetical protein ACXWTF_13035 [Thiomicrolovo sp. ZZH C-3]